MELKLTKLGGESDKESTFESKQMFKYDCNSSFP